MAVDWVAVEVDYRSGSASNREIGAKHGTSESAIRRRVKKQGWTKGAAEAKRERVKAHFAGASDTDITKGLNTATTDDVADMELGLSNARKALGVVGSQLDLMGENPKLADSGDLKRLTETNKINVEVIRKIRGLDDPDDGSDKQPAPYSLDEVLKERAKLLQEF